MSLVKGPLEPSLWNVTLGGLLREQAAKHGNRTSVVVPWQSARLTFSDLEERSSIVARALLAAGMRNGQTVAIMAGNRKEYIEVFLGAARIGCPVVVLNNTYTSVELKAAVSGASCKTLFIASKIGPRSLSPQLEAIGCDDVELSELCCIVLFDHITNRTSPKFITYDAFNDVRNHGKISLNTLRKAENMVQPEDVANLQYTSGTTGRPKAAMLTHNNLINNAQLIGSKMHLTPADVLCCPPPLFHCFGLVIGFLSTFCYGSSIVFPSDVFDPNAVLDAIEMEGCTALHGVPTMFIAELDANKSRKRKMNTLRTGVAAGSAVPAALLMKLEKEMGISGLLICYGMTETSPVTFMTSIDDTKERKLKTLGKVMPHTMAKVVDSHGRLLPRGQPGELCTSGYALQKGYWRNEEKTKEVMKRDENGVLWMHTGDECIIDEHDYCSIAGRIKDMIIRGGENITPLQIEERLLAHSAIADASVVGIQDDKYGEVVGAFLKQQTGTHKPSTQEVKEWVRETLGWHKAPEHVFWMGDAGVGEDFPKTGSGKHQKHIMRATADRVLRQSRQIAKL